MRPADPAPRAAARAAGRCEEPGASDEAVPRAGPLRAALLAPATWAIGEKSSPREIANPAWVGAAIG
jgi:hypothetical protein